MQLQSFARRALTVSALAASAALIGLAPHPAQAQALTPDYQRETASDIGRFAHNQVILRGPASARASADGFANPDQMGNTPHYETPASLRAIYNLPATGGTGVIAVVDAFDYPTALADFNKYSSTFGLPQETSTDPYAATNKVFQVVYQGKTKPGPDPGTNWNIEEALDMEMAHAMAPNAKIILVEALDNSFVNLFKGVYRATHFRGVKEVSMSFSGTEFPGEVGNDTLFQSKPGIVYFASTGDGGAFAGTGYPSVSPYVVGVGGTTINRDANGNFTFEGGWSGSGGGRSVYETRPTYQDHLKVYVGASRSVPDVSYDANPNSGAVIYGDFTADGLPAGYYVVGGTSVSSPAIAGVVNLAGSFAADSYAENTKIYTDITGVGIPADHFNDITNGVNGFGCLPGWDFVTGVGSPNGLLGL